MPKLRANSRISTERHLPEQNGIILTGYPSWFFDGACAGEYDLFFPDDSDEDAIELAKMICAGCPFIKDCYEWQMEHEGALGARNRHGIFGGRTRYERADDYRRSIEPDRPARCDDHRAGTWNGYQTHLRRGETPCHDCLAASRARFIERKDKRANAGS